MSVQQHRVFEVCYFKHIGRAGGEGFRGLNLGQVEVEQGFWPIQGGVGMWLRINNYIRVTRP